MGLAARFSSPRGMAIDLRADVGSRPGASEALRAQAGARRQSAREAWRAALGAEPALPLGVLH